MKVYSITIFKWKEKSPPVLLSSCYDLSSFGFFQRSTVREVLLFASREVVERTQPGVRQTVSHNGNNCHTYTLSSPDHTACAVTTDEEYPQRVAFSLISVCFEEFVKLHSSNPSIENPLQDLDLPVPALEQIIIKYQDPVEADKLLKIQKNLDETKVVLMKTIDQVLERDAKLEDLAKRSQDLSFQSKMFLDKTKENSCCNIL
jgi:synaptobrevin family protein YKT6